MMWAGELGWFGQRLTAWKSDVGYLRERGFHVVELDYRDLSDEEALQAIRSYGNSDGERPAALHGLLVTAHGNPSYFMAKTSGDADWVITYTELDEALSYGLGLVLINACFSDYAKGEVHRTLSHVLLVPLSREGTEADRLETPGGRDLVSGASESIFYGVKGILLPVLETCLASNCLTPGRHGTRV
jgi:hypothetical protein